jgi:hypothetical protein
MNIKEFKAELEKKVTNDGRFIHIVHVGRFAIADIDLIESKIFEYPSDNSPEIKKVLRYLLTINGIEGKVVVPSGVMGDIKQLIEKQPNISHFTVVSTGQGIKTRYSIIPELTIKQDG